MGARLLHKAGHEGSPVNPETKLANKV